MRQKMIKSDVVESVIGLGPNLFYNSPMEACLLITNTNKPKERRGKVLIINAVNEMWQDKNMGLLKEDHIQKIYSAFKTFECQEDFSRVLTLDDIAEQKFNLAINRYVRPDKHQSVEGGFATALKEWKTSSKTLNDSMKSLFANFEEGRP